MDIKEFANAIKPLMEDALGMDVTVLEVKKLNGVTLTGIRVNDPDTNIMPTFYMEPFHALYLKNGSLQECADKIITLFQKERPNFSFPSDWFRDFNQVKKNIAYSLVNYEDNRKLLESMPYTRYLDLAKTYYIKYEDKEIGRGIIRIYNSHLSMWDITAEELASIAEENTPRLLPAKIINMKNFFAELTEGSEDSFGLDTPVKMLVLSNEDTVHGAAAICYPNVLRDVSTRLGSDLVIIPSSIHEMILHPLTAKIRLKDVNAMVTEVNHSQVDADEVLSSHAYIYRRDTDTVEMN